VEPSDNTQQELIKEMANQKLVEKLGEQHMMNVKEMTSFFELADTMLTDPLLA
jgi:hypothetical protein